MEKPTQVTLTAFNRMALKTGCTRVADESYQVMRKIVIAYLQTILKYAYELASHGRRSTIGVEDILHAIELHGFTKIYEEQDKVKACKISNKKTMEARIREYQKQSECYYIPYALFNRLAREILSDFSGVVNRFTQSAIVNLHLATEMYIIKLFQISRQAMEHANRVTLQAKDIYFTLRVIKDLHSTH